MSNTKRITKLDGLRGILSLIVALNHSFLVVAIPVFANVWGQNYLEFHDLQSKIQQYLMILGNGGAAVTMFFILSGLVLGQSLSRVKFSPRGLTAYAIKRLIRLYPVYIFIIVLTALYMRFGFVYGTFPHASSWFVWWMNFQMTFIEFLKNFFFIHTYLGGVTWTLRVIILASLIIPAFYLITKKTTWLIDLFIAGGLVYASFTILNISDFRDLRYLYMFFLGLIIPKFKTFFSQFPSWYITVTLPITILILLAYRFTSNEYTGGLIESIVSWKLVGLIMYSDKTKLFDWLDHKMFQFFGKISYSLYLIHFSVLYIIARFMFQYFPNLPYANHYVIIHSVLFLISLSLATVISILVHKYIEIPSLALSNSINRKIMDK